MRDGPFLMADEPTQAALPIADAPPVEASIPATPQSDPTPSQTDSRKFNADLDAEIAALWDQAEGRAPKALMGEDAPESAEEPAPEPVKATAPKTDAPKAETAPPSPEIDRATIEREAEERARAKIADEQRIQQDAERRVRDEQQHRQAYEAYQGSDGEYAAIDYALKQALAGNLAPLDDLDVTIVVPTADGKRVAKKTSEIKGAKGLTEAEAVNIQTAWDTARALENVMGDRKVSRLVELWNAEVMAELTDPDIDTQAVIQHASPGKQIAELKRVLRDRVTQRLTAQHDEVVKAKDAEIKRLSDRVDSLVNERGNLTARAVAAQAASPDRPGQPGALRTTLPSPEELAAMPFDQAFKNGDVDRILRAIDGGVTTPRRRAG